MGKKSFKDITEKLVEDFYDYILEGGKRHERTLTDIRRQLNEILKKAVQENLLKRNPADGAKINKTLLAKYAKPVIESETFFSFEEAQLFLALADKEYHKDDSKDYFEIFYVALYFALRREEILGLKWSAINFRKKILAICSTVTKGTEINHLDITKTKSSIREYPLTDEQVDFFKRIKRREECMRKKFGASYVENDYVFKNADGAPYYPDTLTNVFSDFIKEHPELPSNVTLHKLRKSCVSILINKGFDILSIQKWIGHKRIDTTLKWYGEVKEKEAKQEISEGLKDIYSPKIYNFE